MSIEKGFQSPPPIRGDRLEMRAESPAGGAYPNRHFTPVCTPRSVFVRYLLRPFAPKFGPVKTGGIWAKYPEKPAISPNGPR